MTQDDFLTTLEAYSAELSAMLGRYTKTQSGISMGQNDEARFKQIGLELVDLFKDELVDGLHHAQMIAAYFNESTRNFFGSPSYRGVENVRGVVSSVITRVKRSPACLRCTKISPGTTTAPERVEALYQIGARFHLVAKQLRVRRQDRPTLDIGDEYDVQDLFHALLRIPFDDVRPEEWTPSYAGGASRVDFLLPEIEAVVEIKKTRPGLSARELGYDTKTEITGHGFRAMARTILHEELEIKPEVIEHQLAHKVADSLGTAYNRTKFIDARIKMMQAWADYLDQLKAGARIIPGQFGQVA